MTVVDRRDEAAAVSSDNGQWRAGVSISQYPFKNAGCFSWSKPGKPNDERHLNGLFHERRMQPGSGRV
jgi:hypothetical protein